MTTTLCETKYPLCMIAGAKFSRSLVLKDSSGDPVDLTGYRAKIHIRGKVTDTAALIVLDSDNSPTEEGSTMEIVAGEGKITFTITPDETLALESVQAGKAVKGVWDLRLSNDDGAQVFYAVSEFLVNPASTRPAPVPEPTPEPDPEP